METVCLPCFLHFTLRSRSMPSLSRGHSIDRCIVDLHHNPLCPFFFSYIVRKKNAATPSGLIERQSDFSGLVHRGCSKLNSLYNGEKRIFSEDEQGDINREIIRNGSIGQEMDLNREK